MAYFESPSKKIPTCIHGRLKTSVHVRRKLAQGEIQALSDPMIRTLDGMMQKHWDIGIISSDSLLLMALKYESIQHNKWDPGGKTTLHLQEYVDVEQWINFLCGKTN